MANPGLAYIFRVELTSLPEEQVSSLLLLPPSALTVIPDWPGRWTSGPFLLFPLPLSSFRVLQCAKWDSLTPDPTYFLEKLLWAWMPQPPVLREHRGVAAPPLPTQDPTDSPPSWSQAHGDTEESSAEPGKTPGALGGPGFRRPQGFPWGPLCRHE